MGISGLKQKNEHRQHNQISLATKFHPTQNLGLFQHCLNHQKLEHYHVALHVQINLGVKFNLKLIILIFLRNIQKEYFFWKTELVNFTI